jgi:hypothetical protein
MDEGTRMINLRNRTLFAFSQRVRNRRLESSDTILNERIGAIDTAIRNSSFETPILNCIPGIKASFLTCLEAILTFAATTNLGPTRSSRFYYLFLSSIAQGYNWVQASGRITGILDQWNWSTQYLLSNEQQVMLWMNRILIAVTTKMVPSFDSSTILANERTIQGLTLATQSAFQATVYSIAHYNDWEGAWTTWWTLRAADGSAAGPPASCRRARTAPCCCACAGGSC